MPLKKKVAKGEKSVSEEVADRDPLKFNRAWCLTLYREEDVHRLRSVPHQAFVCAEEVGGTGKMKHYQIYIRFPNKQRWSWFKSMFHGYVEHPTELGPDGQPMRYWNHWESRRGTEHQARIYIVDPEEYMRTNPRAHPKERGVILHDYGCAVETARAATEELTVIHMVADRAPRWQIFKEHPVFYFKRRRDVIGLEEDVASWHSSGVDYDPRVYKKAEADADYAES